MPIQKITSGVVDTSVFSAPTISSPIVSGNLSLDSTGTTGVRSPAANTLTFHTAGTEDMRITSDGKVGVGTTSPGDRLHVYENTSYVGIKLQNQTSFLTTFVHDGLGGHGFIYKSGALDTAFYNNDVETMRVKSGGTFQFNSGYGSVATAYGCRAWVNFNGTGTVAIRSSGNVSSITDNGTGQYFINFASALTDANYSVTGIGAHVVGVVALFATVREGTRTTSGVEVDFFTVSSTYHDTSDVNVAVFR